MISPRLFDGLDVPLLDSHYRHDWTSIDLTGISDVTTIQNTLNLLLERIVLICQVKLKIKSN